MPRIPCYFDDIMGYCANDFAGERLAIAEFNADHATRTLSPQPGLKYFASAEPHEMWPEMMYFAHNFDHPAYNTSAFVTRGSIIDIDDTVVFTRS